MSSSEPPVDQSTDGAADSLHVRSPAGDSGTAASPYPQLRLTEKRRVDVLVHNVSHADVVISFGKELGEDDEVDDEATLLARPRFGTYARICQELESLADDRLAYAVSERRDRSRPEYPVVLRSRSFGSAEERAALAGDCPSSSSAPKSTQVGTTRLGPVEHRLPAGLRLITGRTWPAERLREELKVRRADVPSLMRSDDDKPLVARRAYFPLLAVVLRAWLDDVAVAGSERKVMLVTGTGTPRDASHPDPTGNSTEAAGRLARKFLQRAADVEVVLLHSESNVFRYDENISFIRHELQPAIEQLRARVVGEDDDWATRFKVSVSFADGAPARVSTIHRSLRPYRPTCVHVWQPKTFWEYQVLTKDDVEVMPFEVTETVPALPANEAEKDVRRVLDETRRRALEFKRAVQQPNDMARFWHRKSRRVVIAVLLVKRPPGSRLPDLYHATNVEVSMPTGSLCAERNVIGSALADDLTLHRSMLQIIAVLGMYLPPDAGNVAPLPSLRGPSLTGADATLASEHQAASSEHPDSPSKRRQSVRNYPKISKNNRTTPDSTTRNYVVEQRDFNPLKPCGCCAEWLKKIARVNPDFKVVTFTDTSCRGYYIESATLY